MSRFRNVAALAALTFVLGAASRAESRVVLEVSSCQHGDSCAFGGPGDADGSVEPGESVSLILIVTNTGNQTALNASATVSTTTPGVTITQPLVSFGDIPASAPGLGMPAVEYTVDASVPCGTPIALDVAMVSDEGNWPGSCAVMVPVACDVCVSRPPDLTIQSCDHVDSCSFGGPTDGNLRVEPGEDVSLTITLGNSGNEDATNVTGVVSSATPGVTVTQPNTSFGTLSGGGSATALTAISYSVDLSVPCGTPLVFDLALSSDQGPFADSCTINVPNTCTPCDVPPVLLRAASCSPTDSCSLMGAGDGNGFVEPGEDAFMPLLIENMGNMEATNVTALVTTSTPGVTITQGAVTVGPIPGFGVGVGRPTPEFSVDGTFPCGTDIVFDIAISSDQGDFPDGCPVSVPVDCIPCALTPANVVVMDCLLSDSCFFGGVGDGDGSIDPGEDGMVVLTLTNTGGMDAGNVNAVVTSATPGVTVTQGSASFGNILASGSGIGTPLIEFIVDGTVPCGTDLVFDVAISSNQGPFNDSCSLRVPGTCKPCADLPIVLSVPECFFSDACGLGGDGDRNGFADPGETVVLLGAVSNAGNADATGVTLTLTTSTPGVTITRGIANVGTVPGFETVPGAPPLELRLDRTVPCGTEVVLDFDIRSDQGDFTDGCSLFVPVSCRPCIDSPPSLTVASCAHDDNCGLGGLGDDDGNPDPGERVFMTLNVANTGSQDATGVSAVVTTATPLVTILQGNTTVGDVAGFRSVAGAPRIDYRVEAGFPCGTEIVFDVAISSDQGPFPSDCRITVPVACRPCDFPVGYEMTLEATSVPVDTCDLGGDGHLDGGIDPGEMARLRPSIWNIGPGNATAVTGTLVSLTPGVTVLVATANYGDVANGALAMPMTPFEIEVGLGLTCSQRLLFRLDISSTEGQARPVAVDDLALASPCIPCTLVAPPEEVPWLIARCLDTDELELEWLPAPGALVHEIHQGTLAALGGAPSPWDHACVLKDLVDPLLALVPTATCGDGQDLYFLAIGRNDGGAGPYGLSDVGGGTQRDFGAPCP